MIGIDLVDLNVAAVESNPFRNGYLNKVFSTAEQTLIADASEPLTMVWLLWSMKEAVYKICARTLSIRILAPIDIQCFIINLSQGFSEGKVWAYNEVYYTHTTICSGYLYSLAATQKDMLNNVEATLHPYPASFDYHATAPQSVSHHGSYLALAYYPLTKAIDRLR